MGHSHMVIEYAATIKALVPKALQMARRALNRLHEKRTPREYHPMVEGSIFPALLDDVSLPRGTITFTEARQKRAEARAAKKADGGSS